MLSWEDTLLLRMGSRSTYPSATLICGDLNRMAPRSEEGQGEGRKGI